VEAEEVCRKAIADFPAEVVPRTSLAAVLRAAGRYAEAEAEYRTINKDFPDAAVPFVGLAYLLLRQGAKHRAEVLNLVSTALKLDPKNRYAVRLQSQLVTAPGEALAAIADEWDTVVGQLLEGSPRYHDVATDDSRQEIRPADAGETQDLDPCTPPSADVDSRDTDARSTQPPKPIVDPVHLAALLAEASFYRAWAVRSAPEAAEQLRERAEDCLARAEGLAPGDVCVAAEYAALEAAHVPPEKLDRRLAVELGKYPASTRLLVLKARVEREQARLSQRRLTEESLAELLLAPARLRALDPSLVPVFHLQRGLAALALTNGDMRRQKAAEGFESFRRVVARRAAEERADREASRDFRAAGMLGFHEWLCETTEARLFRGLPVQGEVSAESVQALEQSLPAARALFEEVEEVMVGRLVFSSV
jgi:tetratricopeptide (TPR) repeat protein